MSKAFVRDDAGDDDNDDDELPEAGAALLLTKNSLTKNSLTKNYMTPAGHQRMKTELLQLLDHERPEVVKIVSWAASNGDRSENGDYLYGKKRLREIDRRIRFLSKRLDIAEVVDPTQREASDQIFFGASVRYSKNGQIQPQISIVGIDETDPLRGLISWISPMAKALIKAREGDVISLRTPAGVDEIEIIAVQYRAIELSSGAKPD
jgi:transcription elongation factor GreB